MDYSIVPATIVHVHKLAASIREADAQEARSMGGDPRRLLRASFRSSLYSRAVIIDGEVAAVGGLSGDVLSDEGRPWLVTGKAIERLTPRQYLEEAHRQVGILLSIKPRLENYVAADYRKAVRLLEVLGFDLDSAAPFGRCGGLFRRFTLVR